MEKRTRKLGHIAKETVARLKYDGQLTEKAARRVRHQAEIDKVLLNLKDTVMAAANKKREQVDLLGIGGGCVKDDSAHNRGLTLMCDQCQELVKHLEAEDLVVRVTEDKHIYHITASWKAQS